MKNRKFLALAAVLIVLCLLLAACSSTDIKKQNAYQLVKGAVEKTGKLDSYQLDMNINTITDILGTKMESPINFNIKTEGASGKSPKASGTMTMSLLGFKIDCDLYMENNTLYISMMGSKVKMDASSEEAKSYQFSDT